MSINCHNKNNPTQPFRSNNLSNWLQLILLLVFSWQTIFFFFFSLFFLLKRQITQIWNLNFKKKVWRAAIWYSIEQHTRKFNLILWKCRSICKWSWAIFAKANFYAGNLLQKRELIKGRRLSADNKIVSRRKVYDAKLEQRLRGRSKFGNQSGAWVCQRKRSRRTRESISQPPPPRCFCKGLGPDFRGKYLF